MIHLNIKYLNKLQKHLNILKIIEKCIAILGQKILNVHVIPAQEVKSFAASSLSLRSKCTYVCICHTTNTFISLSTREHFVANYFLRQKIILFDTVRKMLLIATKGEILTNRCTSADDLLQHPPPPPFGHTRENKIYHRVIPDSRHAFSARRERGNLC